MSSKTTQPTTTKQLSDQPWKNDDHMSLRYPTLDDKAHMLIALAVLVPIVIIVLLCTITWCAYRYHKRRHQASARNTSITPIIQHDAVMNNTSRNPFTTEESPPSYDLISETKKDPQFTSISNSTNELYPLSVISPTIVTPPPSYSNYPDPKK